MFHRINTCRPDIMISHSWFFCLCYQIKAEASEVMSEDDVGKLDDMFALIQQKRDEYREERLK